MSSDPGLRHPFGVLAPLLFPSWDAWEPQEKDALTGILYQVIVDWPNVKSKYVQTS